MAQYDVRLFLDTGISDFTHKNISVSPNKLLAVGSDGIPEFRYLQITDLEYGNMLDTYPSNSIEKTFKSSELINNVMFSEQLIVEDFETELAVSDGYYFHKIADKYDGFKINSVRANVIVAGLSDTSEILSIDIYNVTQDYSILSTELTIDDSDYCSDTATTPYVINTSNNTVTKNDILRIDITSVHTSTFPQGLILTLTYKPI
jgi:hypothetical protein